MTVAAVQLVAILKAAGEITRMRILALLSQGELSVKDFTEILGQSQPRISRHLKLLVDAGLAVRHAEGAWAYFRLADAGVGAALAGFLLDHIAVSAPEFRRDHERLDEVRAQRKAHAARYFASIAANWDRERSLHVPEAAVEAHILKLVARRPVEILLDLGTGTGRMLELLAPYYRRAIGLDASREMLAVARAKLDGAAIAQAQVRLADISYLGDYAGIADLVVLHQVLHYFDDPVSIVREARRVLRDGGRIIVVDFAPHRHGFLHAEHAHLRMGISEAEMSKWASAAGLAVESLVHFPDQTGEGLTVSLWCLSVGGADHLVS